MSKHASKPVVCFSPVALPSFGHPKLAAERGRNRAGKDFQLTQEILRLYLRMTRMALGL